MLGIGGDLTFSGCPAQKQDGAPWLTASLVSRDYGFVAYVDEIVLELLQTRAGLAPRP